MIAEICPSSNLLRPRSGAGRGHSATPAYRSDTLLAATGLVNRIRLLTAPTISPRCSFFQRRRDGSDPCHQSPCSSRSSLRRAYDGLSRSMRFVLCRRRALLQALLRAQPRIRPDVLGEAYGLGRGWTADDHCACPCAARATGQAAQRTSGRPRSQRSPDSNETIECSSFTCVRPTAPQTRARSSMWLTESIFCTRSERISERPAVESEQPLVWPGLTFLRDCHGASEACERVNGREHLDCQQRSRHRPHLYTGHPLAAPYLLERFGNQSPEDDGSWERTPVAGGCVLQRRCS